MRRLQDALDFKRFCCDINRTSKFVRVCIKQLRYQVYSAWQSSDNYFGEKVY